MALTSFLIEYKWVLLFYIIIFSLIYINRKKFDIKGIVALYRTKFGLKFIDKITARYKELIKLIGYIGIGAGYVGLITISVILVKNLFSLLTKPEAEAAVGLIIPGVHIPGSPIFLPFWFGIIALFTVVLIHEFGHGIVAKAHGLKIKSSGFGMFAIFPIAFVEPEEKHLRKQKDTVQYSVFAAGPFFNILTAFLVILILSFIFIPVQGAITNPVGFSISGVQEGFPAEAAGLKGGMIITEINNIPTKDYNAFSEAMKYVKPGEKITVKADNSLFEITTTNSPDDNTKPYLGITGLDNEVRLKNDSPLSRFLFSIFTWFKTLFGWIGVLSLGIGLANLLPLGPVDGGRMLQVSLLKLTKDKEKGNKIWINITIICLFILIINIFLPLLRSIFS